ncbi:MAG: glycosyl hydrolase [Tannerella sp.]|jgi:hypothetical protein|nr:glycosyl hydrolase [Tannerella sp.]
MKNNKLYYTLIITLLILLDGCGICDSKTPLEQGFDEPPTSAKPGVYWYFMDGNLSAEGMTKDLEAMKNAGIGHVLFLEVNVGIKRGEVDFLSEKWQELFVHAVRECERLNINMILGIGPGWNGSGGPWVEASQSMQHLVYSITPVSGGKGVQTISLPVPPPKQPFFGEGNFTPEAHQRWKDYYQDVAVLAIPAGITRIDTAAVSGPGYRYIPEIDERALYYRKPYSSVEGVPQYIPLYENFTPQKDDKAVNINQIKDLTALLKPDGTIEWDAPENQWIVMRFGARNNGAATRPAPIPGVGFEADKFDTVAMIRHFENFTGKLFDRLGFTQSNPSGGGIKTLHIDSWEMGAQNWTAHFRDEFKQRRGYDPQPYYPVYAGFMVGDRETSERFLWDLRQTAQELVKEYHVGFVRRYAQRFGLNVSIEPYDMNPTADMELASAADIPMAEFWGMPDEFDYKGYNTAWGATEASSVAHLIGQPLVPAEAFTAHLDGWRQYPASVKNQGDWAFAAGINRLMYHTFEHQPLPDSLRPGMTMGPYGLHWDRNQTWWYLSKAYHTYVARCQFMLQQGRTVADVLYLAPEMSPYVFRAPPSAYVGSNELPDRRGYSFDACPPSLLYDATVASNGDITFPSGATYKILVLPNFKTMRPELLRKLFALVNDGATIVGLPPVKSPSLSNYPACDEEVNSLAAQMWGTIDVLPEKLTFKPTGKGQIVYRRDFAETDYPDYETTSALLRNLTYPDDFNASNPLRYTHRTTPDAEIYFVSNPTGNDVSLEASFRVTGKSPEIWHPVTGERRNLPQYTSQKTTTSIKLKFSPYESYFIVFKNFADKTVTDTDEENFPSYKIVATLDNPWEVSFDPKWGGPAKVTFNKLTDWTLSHDPSVKYYSGTAFYHQKFDLHNIKGNKYIINLGKVKNIARVTINGKTLATIWTYPWQTDITQAVKEGANDLKIEVVNLWPNRLIGDMQDGTKRYTYSTFNHYKKESQLLESGLLGPVTIMCQK